MSMILPTVTVNRDGAKAVINESDYNPENDVLWEEPEASKDDEPEGDIRVVDQGGGWFKVFDGETEISEKSMRKDDAEALAAEHRIASSDDE